MRILLLYPVFPKTMFTFEKPMEYMGKKALLPPLGLITVAAILPQKWEFKLVDRNIRDVTEDEWDWAELVMISTMIVQKKDFLEQVQETKRRGKPVAVGGPYPTAFLDEVLPFLLCYKPFLTQPSGIGYRKRDDCWNKVEMVTKPP